MLDERLRRAYTPWADAAAARLARVGLRPGHVTLAGLLAGLGAVGAILLDAPIVAVSLWLLNRLLDGLDGPLARRLGSSDLGGFLDFGADLVVYASIPAALGAADPALRLSLLVLVAAFYANAGMHLTLSGVLEKRDAAGNRSGRSILLLPGVAEGFETIVAYALLVGLPSMRVTIAWSLAAIMLLAIVQRLHQGIVLLRSTPRDRARSAPLEDAT